jgi:peptidoglycan/LPS O-acetylase OafA/YrhL
MIAKVKKHAGTAKKFASEKLAPYVNMTFQVLLIAFLLVLLVNEFYKLKFINMNLLLIIVVVFGVLSILLPSDERKKLKRKSLYGDILVYIIGIIGGVVVFLKTQEMGWLSYVIAVVTFLLVVLLGSIVYDDSSEKKRLDWQD